MPLDPEIRVEGDGPVRRLTLNRPARHNAQTPRLGAQLAAAGHALAADADVRCVVISGAGKSFSSGIDLGEMRNPDGFIRGLAAHPTGDPDPMLPAIATAQEAFRWIPQAPFLVIAAVTGVALGAGCQLALACDIRIVADSARLGLREVRYGLIPDMGATSALPRLVGRERALDLILTGREFTGAEAVAMGLALRACPVDEPDPVRSLRLAGLGQAACIRQAPVVG